MSSPTPYYPNEGLDNSESARPYHHQDYAATGDFEQSQNAMHEEPHYPDPTTNMPDNPYTATDPSPRRAAVIPMQPEFMEATTNLEPRSKAVPKPDREVIRDQKGFFICMWPDCSEDVKEFKRKCEWNKHMDKHDRPYKCNAEGCEKLPGFTYSGGLLRHEREVHNKHGGPRKQLNCPYANCKRATGKGFSRQENLNEHLRRVHTDGAAPTQDPVTEDMEEDATEATVKRKRNKNGEPDIREEMKRLKHENAELRLQTEQQKKQTAEMIEQIKELQTRMHPKMAPAAQMV